MSLEELREQNKQLVVEKALECFIENGVDQTKIKDIAKAAKLTERSIYRYFETKVDIIQAATYLYWAKTLEEKAKAVEECNIGHMTGIEQISVLLNMYGSMFNESPKGVRFTIDAEMALYKAGRNKQVLNRPPVRFELSTSPVVMAIQKGLEDGSVSPKVDVKELYYNAYDAILGVMQRLSMDTTSASELDVKNRMEHLCNVFVQAFKGETAS